MELLLSGCVLFLVSGHSKNRGRMLNFKEFLFVVFYDVATPAGKISLLLSSCRKFAVVRTLRGTHRGMCALAYLGCYRHICIPC
jgi:hypothetical protein